MLLVVLCGCGQGDETPRPADGVPAPGPSATTDTAPPPAADDPEAALVQAACLAGDPAQGIPWRIEHAAAGADTLAMHPLAALAPRDSARMVARVARAADVMTADTSVADFRGLPVDVRDAWVIVPAEGDTTVLAVVARRQPMESSPLEEHLTLLTAPDTMTDRRRPLTVRWSARSAGTEEQLETLDPLAALALADGTLRLLLVRESAGRPQVESVGRDAAGRWSVRWRGELAPCP